MQNRLNTLESYGIPTEFHAYEGLPHGFGLGTGTVAEGWIYDAVNFWEEQFSGTIPTKREPANLQNWLLKRKLLNGSIEFGTQKKTALSWIMCCITIHRAISIFKLYPRKL